MKVSILTLGCKVNQAEMSTLENSLRGMGHEVVGLDGNPDLCVVNTCAVTSKSDYQSRQLIRRAGKTGAKVIATGCYSELNAEAVGRMERVQAVVGNKSKSNIIKLIDSNSKSAISGHPGGRARYFLKVQDGCDNSCSYCIVPRARGASRSVRPGEVVESIGRAVEDGFKEVVLTGIHLGQYGRDIHPAVPLASLIEEILDKTGIARLRLSSLEVNELDGRLLNLFGDQRLMPHLHVPLQSGDDEVLKLMNRGYGTAFFRETLDRVVGKLPDAAIGTDIIAGFPAETPEAFERTLEFVEGLPLTYLHVFPYSERPGTPATSLRDIVGPPERKRRASALRELSQRKKSAFMDRQIGKTLSALVEESFENGSCLGTSSNYLKIRLPISAQMRGSVVPVRVAGVGEGMLLGEPVSSPEPSDFSGKFVCPKPVQ